MQGDLSSYVPLLVVSSVVLSWVTTLGLLLLQWRAISALDNLSQVLARGQMPPRPMPRPMPPPLPQQPQSTELVPPPLPVPVPKPPPSPSSGTGVPSIPVKPAPLITDHIDLANLRSEYLQDWQALIIAPQHAAVVANDAKKVLLHKAAYQNVEHATGVPWWVVGIIDMMEGGGGANTNPCNGQTLARRTTLVPPGRPPAPLEPPFSFQDAAVDAMTYMGFDKIKTWTIDVVSWVFEKQNGFGYRRSHDMRSPYLYGFSNLEQPGRYVSDHVFDPHAPNQQAGALTILKALIQLDPTIQL